MTTTTTSSRFQWVQAVAAWLSAVVSVAALVVAGSVAVEQRAANRRQLALEQSVGDLERVRSAWLVTTGMRVDYAVGESDTIDSSRGADVTVENRSRYQLDSVVLYLFITGRINDDVPEASPKDPLRRAYNVQVGSLPACTAVSYSFKSFQVGAEIGPAHLLQRGYEGVAFTDPGGAWFLHRIYGQRTLRKATQFDPQHEYRVTTHTGGILDSRSLAGAPNPATSMLPPQGPHER
jgi:hypothetical protein